MANLLMLLGAELSIFSGLLLFAWAFGQMGRNLIQTMRFTALTIGLTNIAVIVTAL